MEFTTAVLQQFDPATLSFDEVRTITVQRNAEDQPLIRIVLHQRESHLAGPITEVRVYSNTERDADNDRRLVNRHEVWSPTLTVFGDRLFLDGFTLDLDGATFDDPSQEFVKVRWVLQ